MKVFTEEIIKNLAMREQTYEVFLCSRRRRRRRIVWDPSPDGWARAKCHPSLGRNLHSMGLGQKHLIKEQFLWNGPLSWFWNDARCCDAPPFTALSQHFNTTPTGVLTMVQSPMPCIRHASIVHWWNALPVKIKSSKLKVWFKKGLSGNICYYMVLLNMFFCVVITSYRLLFQKSRPLN